jgi:excisionase family DNA binding protein
MYRRTIDADEVADYLGVSRDLIYELVRQRKIPHNRIGKKRIVFRRQAIEQWLAEQEFNSINH